MMKRFCSLVMAAVLVLGLTACSSQDGRSTPLPTETTAPAATTSPETTAPAATTSPETTAPAATEPPVTEPVMSYVEVFREGEGSQIPVEIIRGTVGSYTMAMDPEYFTFYPQETVDLFSYDTWEDGPGVFYAVSDYRDDADHQQFIDDTVAQFAPLFDTYSTEETALGAYPATAVYFSDFELDPAYQYHIFLVNCDGNYYLIEASFVFEMYEGLYAIMQACFDTLTPVAG